MFHQLFFTSEKTLFLFPHERDSTIWDALTNLAGNKRIMHTKKAEITPELLPFWCALKGFVVSRHSGWCLIDILHRVWCAAVRDSFPAYGSHVSEFQIRHKDLWQLWEIFPSDTDVDFSLQVIIGLLRVFCLVVFFFAWEHHIPVSGANPLLRNWFP